MKNLEKLEKIANEHPYPLLFATVSGAHLYGFPSEDSDYDLRGVHILPLKNVVGIELGDDTLQIEEIREGLELDLVTHDVKKFFELMLKRNGYVLEQLLSPLVVKTTPEHSDLIHISKRCLTKYHTHHYMGFAQNQWKLFLKETPQKVKQLLYVFRVLLTGIHLMRSGEVLANLVELNEEYKITYISELIDRKVNGAEKEILPDADLPIFEQEYEKLLQTLVEAKEKSVLPEKPTAKDELNELLIHLRLKKFNC